MAHVCTVAQWLENTGLRNPEPYLLRWWKLTKKKPKPVHINRFWLKCLATFAPLKARSCNNYGTLPPILKSPELSWESAKYVSFYVLTVTSICFGKWLKAYVRVKDSVIAPAYKWCTKTLYGQFKNRHWSMCVFDCSTLSIPYINDIINCDHLKCLCACVLNRTPKAC